MSAQENIPIEEVFENLRCSPQGLSTAQAEQRLAIFGPNKLEEKQVKESAVFGSCFSLPVARPGKNSVMT